MSDLPNAVVKRLLAKHGDGMRVSGDAIEKAAAAAEDYIARLAREAREYLAAHGEIRFDAALVHGHHTSVQLIAPRVFRAQHSLLDDAGEEQGFVEGEVDLREARDPEGPLVRLLGLRP